MKIRSVIHDEACIVTQIGQKCFPDGESVSQEVYMERIRKSPDHFLALEVDGHMAGFISGLATNREYITDDMFINPRLHEENGRWEAVLGIAVLPAFKKRGYAERLMRHFVSRAARRGRRGCILTCKEELIGYYEKLGYVHEGLSESKLASRQWHNMYLEFRKTGADR